MQKSGISTPCFSWLLLLLAVGACGCAAFCADDFEIYFKLQIVSKQKKTRP